jgi:signal transduction histidine kinase
MGHLLLALFDWALIATSLFNTVALIWLGLTVLLNAERRAWGTWVAGCGLLFGAAFFIGHTAVVGRVLGTFSGEMELWWRLGWLVLLAAPYLWYLVMAWYSGALGRPAARGWLIAVSVVGLLALATLLLADPLPDYSDVVTRGTAPLFAAGPLPAVALVYPVYSVLCTLFALAVLRAPAGSERFMGDEARRRARPWLTAATWALLAVGLAVGAAATWVLQQVRQGELPVLSGRVLAAIVVFDLFVSLLIAVATVLIGQAIVAYEVFTGKALPRGQLRRQWRRALILAAGYGLAVGWSLSGVGIPRQPIYQLLIATVLMTVFFALLGWRSFEERERALGGLRPFVSGRRLYDGLVGGAGPADPAHGPEGPFRALCGELLGASAAYLVPLGSMAALAGPPLTLRRGVAAAPAHAAAALAAGLPSPPPLCLPVEPAAFGGAQWAVPLSGERGLIGLLLLGAKSDGGLYTEEEIALARGVAERLVDGEAGAEMARRLVALQRRRLAEDQVLDRRARRLLHDEVLPQIHAAILEHGQEARLREQLSAIHKQISNLLHDLPSAAGLELERHGPLGALRRAVEGELAEAFDELSWQIDPEAEAAARLLDPLRAEALFYAAREAARNAARHGRGGEAPRHLALRIAAGCRPVPGGPPLIEVSVEDDGVGFAPARPAAPGGAGLALHGTILAILGGALSVESVAGRTRVTASVPGA